MTVSPKLQLQQLVDLQKMDDEISECRNILNDIPRQLDSARGELEEKKNILKVVMDEIERLQKERKSLEQEVQSENDHMAKAKIKLRTSRAKNGSMDDASNLATQIVLLKPNEQRCADPVLAINMNMCGGFVPEFVMGTVGKSFEYIFF